MGKHSGATTGSGGCGRADGVVKYHRTVSGIVTGLLSAGFMLGALLEPEPAPDSVGTRPCLGIRASQPAPIVLSAGRG